MEALQVFRNIPGFTSVQIKLLRERETDRGLDRNGVLDEVGKK